jgi:hypothetical protein
VKTEEKFASGLFIDAMILLFKSLKKFLLRHDLTLKVAKENSYSSSLLGKGSLCSLSSSLVSSSDFVCYFFFPAGSGEGPGRRQNEARHGGVPTGLRSLPEWAREQPRGL